MRRAWCAALAVALQLQRAAGDDDIVFREHVVSTTFPKFCRTVPAMLASQMDLTTGNKGAAKGLAAIFDTRFSDGFVAGSKLLVQEMYGMHKLLLDVET